MSTPDVFASEVFGAPVIRVEPEEIDDHDAWRQEGVWLAWLRMEMLWESPSDKWRHIETLETYRGWLEAPFAETPTCERTNEFVVECGAIAAQAFTQDRWHRDSRIPKGKADLFKALWAVSSLTDGYPYAHVHTYLEQDKKRINGFLSYRRADLSTSSYRDIVIDLLAVHPKFQGHHVAKNLISSVIHEQYGTFTIGIRASTQAHNTAAKAFYESLGFVKVSEQHTYHWINEEAAP